MFRYQVDHYTDLRILEPRDAVHLYNLIENNRKDLQIMLPWFKNVLNVSVALSFIQQGLNYFKEGLGFYTGIWSEGELLGVIMVDKIDRRNNSTTMGCWLASSYQGRGIMFKSSIPIINHLFNTVNINRIEIRTLSSNSKTISLVEKVGFKREGKLKEVELIEDSYNDHYIYALLKSEWRNP